MQIISRYSKIDETIKARYALIVSIVIKKIEFIIIKIIMAIII
jgi:hypothetical protein